MIRKILLLILSFLIVSLQVQSQRNNRQQKAGNRQEKAEKRHDKTKKDTLKVYLKNWYQDSYDMTVKNIQQADTTTNYFQITNTANQASFGNIYLGTPGWAAYPVIYDGKLSQLPSAVTFPSKFEDFNDTPFLFSRYTSYNFIKPQNIKFYNTNKPFTNLYYTSARKREEQQLKVFHTQNINPFLNFSFMLNGISSGIAFTSQKKIKLISYGGTINFENKRYRATAIITHNKLETDQTGGFVVNDSLNRKDSDFPANLNDLRTKELNQHISLKQSVYFKKRRIEIKLPISKLEIANDSIANDSIITNYSIVKDSIANDSISLKKRRNSRPKAQLKRQTPRKTSEVADSASADTTNQSLFAKKFYDFFYSRDSVMKYNQFDYLFSLSHKISFDKHAFNYSENSLSNTTLSYFKNFYWDSVPAYDSAYYHQLKNAVQLNIHENPGKPNALSGYAAIENEMNKLYNFRDFILLLNDSTLHSTCVKGGLKGKLFDLFRWNAHFKYYFEGEKEKNKMLYANISHSIRILKDTLHLSAEILHKSVKSNIFEKRYFSNHFQWLNSFADKQTEKIGVTASFPLTRTRLHVSYTTLTNYVFFNEEAVPEQYNENISIVSASLNQDFHFGYFWSKNKVAWQHSDNQMVLPLPQICAYSSFYFEKKLFNVLNVQLGVDAFFNTKWYAHKYMPATSQFYNQHDKKYGNMPFLNLFLNCKLKNRALFFLKGENMLELFTEEKYIPLPAYPVNATMFRFGVSWWFHD